MFSKNYIKSIKKLKDKKYILSEKKFLVEGKKNFEELSKSDFFIEAILCTENFYKENFYLKEKFKNISIIKEEELEKIGNFCTNNSVIAICHIKESFESDLCSSKIILQDIKDPGNLGTIIRTADWFGIKEIVCSANSVFFYNWKVIQASMGSFFRVKIFYENLNEYLGKLKIPLYIADLNGEDINLVEKKDCAILFGNESFGVCHELKKYANKVFTISKNKNSICESLNLSCAVSIFCEKFYSR